ncbi:MAG: efflux RND transporter periplasmic adaptor subunit [Armatimonadota bacterium]
MKTRNIIILIIIIIAVILIWRAATRAEIIETVNPQVNNVTELVIASGLLKAKYQPEIGSEVIGTVKKVYVEEGDYVSKGQLLVLLSDEVASQQIAVSESIQKSAELQLKDLSNRPISEEIARAKAEVDQARLVNTARLRAAQKKLEDLKKGSLQSEINEAKALLEQSKVNAKLAQDDLNRAEDLYNKGAISKADLDRANANYKTAVTAQQAAESRLERIKSPVSNEAIEAAKADVEAARYTLEQSVSIAQKNLNLLLAKPTSDEINILRNKVSEAGESVKLQKTLSEKYKIISPIDGIVTKRIAEPGFTISPGMSLLKIADMSNTEIYVETDENNLSKLKLGQKAVIFAPAFPEKPFRAKLIRIGPGVDNVRGVVGLTLKPDTLPEYARPDMTVDVNIEVSNFKNSLTLPSTSIITIMNDSFVFVIENNRLKRKKIEVLGSGGGYTAVKDIDKNTIVAKNASGLKEGKRVKPVEAK